MIEVGDLVYAKTIRGERYGLVARVSKHQVWAMWCSNEVIARSIQNRGLTWIEKHRCEVIHRCLANKLV